MGGQARIPAVHILHHLRPEQAVQEHVMRRVAQGTEGVQDGSGHRRAAAQNDLQREVTKSTCKGEVTCSFLSGWCAKEIL